MNKQQLLKEINAALILLHKTAHKAAARAYSTATNDQNKAENKYDTLALEASYLAHGQAQRLAQCEADIIAFEALCSHDKLPITKVKMGAYVELIDQQGQPKYLFIGPSSGGLKVTCCEKHVLIVTPESPLVSVLMGRELDDEVTLSIGDKKICYEITGIC